MSYFKNLITLEFSQKLIKSDIKNKINIDCKGHVLFLET